MRTRIQFPSHFSKVIFSNLHFCSLSLSSHLQFQPYLTSDTCLGACISSMSPPRSVQVKRRFHAKRQLSFYLFFFFYYRIIQKLSLYIISSLHKRWRRKKTQQYQAIGIIPIKNALRHVQMKRLRESELAEIFPPTKWLQSENESQFL